MKSKRDDQRKSLTKDRRQSDDTQNSLSAPAWERLIYPAPIGLSQLDQSLCAGELRIAAAAIRERAHFLDATEGSKMDVAITELLDFSRRLEARAECYEFGPVSLAVPTEDSLDQVS